MQRRELVGIRSKKVWDALLAAEACWAESPERAVSLAEEAWRLVPEPREQWYEINHELASRAADAALTAGDTCTVGRWLERLRAHTDPDDRREQASCWALVGRHALQLGRAEQSVAALDAMVAAHGYFYALAEHPDVVEQHRRAKGLLPARIPRPEAPGATPPPDTLTEDDLARLADIYERASALDDAEQHADSLAVWGEAWDVIPAPTVEWSWSATVYGGIGEALYWAGDHATAELAFQYASRCPGGDQPVVHARIAQCLEARGDHDLAEDLWAEAEDLQPGITELARSEGS